MVAFTTMRVRSERAPVSETILWKLKGLEGTPILLDDGQADAAFQLRQLGPQAKSAIPAMIASLKDPDLLTRRFAIEMLEATRPTSRRRRRKRYCNRRNCCARIGLGNLADERLETLAPGVLPSARWPDTL